MTKDPQLLLHLAETKLSQSLSLLEQLVNQNSYTHNIEGVNKVQTLLESAFKDLGLITTRYSFNERGDILVAESNPENAETILLIGHADTVHPPSPNNKKFSQDKDSATGDGIFDMKSGVLQILLVLQLLKDSNALSKRNYKVIINSAEEDTIPETCAFIQSVGKNAKTALVFEFGRANNGIVVERKGMIELWISSNGKQSHAGNAFYEGDNAIVTLSSIIPSLTAITDKEKDITLNIGCIEGGNQLGVVPSSARLGLEIRGTIKSHIDDSLKKINAIIQANPKLSLTIISSTPPLNKAPGTQELLNSFILHGNNLGITFTEMPRVGGLSDANHIGESGVPTIDGLGPTGGGAHTCDEFISLSSLSQRAGVIASFLLKYS